MSANTSKLSWLRGGFIPGILARCEATRAYKGNAQESVDIGILWVFPAGNEALWHGASSTGVGGSLVS